MKLIKANLSHLEELMEVIQKAKAFMAPQGSGQWQDGHPSVSTITTDIENGQYFVCIYKGRVVGGFAMLDFDFDYSSLLEGKWLNQEPYKVIHRLAVDPSIHRQGIGSYLLLNAEAIARKKNIFSIRIDTHELNAPMIGLLKKLGYIKIGICLLGQIKRRVVFQKILQPL